MFSVTFCPEDLRSKSFIYAFTPAGPPGGSELAVSSAPSCLHIWPWKHPLCLTELPVGCGCLPGSLILAFDTSNSSLSDQIASILHFLTGPSSQSDGRVSASSSHSWNQGEEPMLCTCTSPKQSFRSRGGPHSSELLTGLGQRSDVSLHLEHRDRSCFPSQNFP